MIDTVLVIGGGLIGSSILRAVQHRLPDIRLGLIDCDQSTVDKAENLGAFVSTTIEAAVVNRAELILIATPLDQYPSVGQRLAQTIARPMIISDVGSTKQQVSREMAAILPTDCRWLPGHPVAGTELSGFDAGFPELFVDRYVILTSEPSRPAPPVAVDTLAWLWEKLGATVSVMTPERHDRILAITSHLPHLLAFALVGSALEIESRSPVDDKDQTGEVLPLDEVLRYSAGGFRDFTRIAASDPAMWRDVFISNRSALLEMLGRFTEDLLFLQRAIRYENQHQLLTWFQRAREARQTVLSLKQAGRFIPTEKENDGV